MRTHAASLADSVCSLNVHPVFYGQSQATHFTLKPNSSGVGQIDRSPFCSYYCSCYTRAINNNIPFVSLGILQVFFKMPVHDVRPRRDSLSKSALWYRKNTDKRQVGVLDTTLITSMSLRWLTKHYGRRKSKYVLEHLNHQNSLIEVKIILEITFTRSESVTMSAQNWYRDTMIPWIVLRFAFEYAKYNDTRAVFPIK